MATATTPGWGQRLAALALLLLVGGALYLAVDQWLIGRYRDYQNQLQQQLSLIHI